MRLVKYAIVLAAGLLLAGAVSAQPPRPGQPSRGQPGGFGFGGGLTFLLTNSKELQDELKLNKDQVEEVSAALRKVREDNRELSEKLRNRDTAQGEREEITRKLTEANNKALAEVLKPEQLKRYRQIENQLAGMRIFAKEDVQKALKLTDDQKERISTITQELSRDLRELSGTSRGRPDPEATKKREGLTEEANEGIRRVLTKDQQETLKDLKGAPFEMPRFSGFGGPDRGGFSGFSQPGTVLSQGIQGALRLTDEQKKELETIQKEVDSRLEKLLTEEQRTQLKQMRDGGRGGRPGRPSTNPNP